MILIHFRNLSVCVTTSQTKHTSSPSKQGAFLQVVETKRWQKWSKMHFIFEQQLQVLSMLNGWVERCRKKPV
jgi:hypothetical protein